MDSGMITKQELENKYVFWDIDGTGKSRRCGKQTQP